MHTTFISQKKRRKFSSRRNKGIQENTNFELVSLPPRPTHTPRGQYLTFDPSQNTTDRGGLIGGEATAIPEEEEPADDSLPVPLDMEDRSAYDGAAKKTWMPKLRPPSFVTGNSGSSPNTPRRVVGASQSPNQTTAYQSTNKERRYLI